MRTESTPARRGAGALAPGRRIRAPRQRWAVDPAPVKQWRPVVGPPSQRLRPAGCRSVPLREGPGDAWWPCGATPAAPVTPLETLAASAGAAWGGRASRPVGARVLALGVGRREGRDARWRVWRRHAAPAGGSRTCSLRIMFRDLSHTA